MDNLGIKIKTLREKNKISKSELARLINISPAYVTMLENGLKKNPSIDILKKIATVLEVPLSELINDMKYGGTYKLNKDIDFKIIKKYREQMNLSQENLSELIDIEVETLKGIEAGTIKNPRIDYAIKLNSLFKPNPPFCYYEEENNSLFDGPGILAKTLNDILNSGVYQSTNCRMDKKIILMDYIKRFLEDKYINLNTSEIIEICDFLTPVIDPLLKHKVDEILGKHNKEK